MKLEEKGHKSKRFPTGAARLQAMLDPVTPLEYEPLWALVHCPPSQSPSGCSRL